MPAGGPEIKDSRVSSDPVIPNGNVVRFPLVPYLEVWIFADLAEKKLEDGVRFGLWKANNPTGEA